MDYNEIRDEETSQRNGVIKMSKEELIKVIRELYKLWHMQDTDEDIDYILAQVIREIGKGE